MANHINHRKRDELYRWIIWFKVMNNGNSPSFDEIVKAMEFASTSVAHHYLDALQTEGRIKMDTGKARMIEVIGGRWLPPPEYNVNVAPIRIEFKHEGDPLPVA